MRKLPFLKRKAFVAVLLLEGIIHSGGRMRSTGLSDSTMAPVIERAFGRGKPSAVAIKINSPGGSPVQSSLIAARIRRLAESKGIPVYAFVEDVAASGGYWLAVAADEIYVDANSIVGSIGVIHSSFGFQDLLQKSGIERRVHTAGKDKSILDPFLPEDPDHVERLKELQSQIHHEFIEQVRSRRGDQLNGDDLFTGRFWAGRTAVELGLADGIGHLIPKMQEVFGEKIRFKQYGKRRNLLGTIGTGVAHAAFDHIEDRLLMSRYGL